MNQFNSLRYCVSHEFIRISFSGSHWSQKPKEGHTKRHLSRRPKKGHTKSNQMGHRPNHYIICSVHKMAMAGLVALLDLNPPIGICLILMLLLLFS